MALREQRERFDAEGFLAFDPQIEESIINEARSALDALYLPEEVPADRSGEIAAFRDSRRIQDAWRTVPAVRTIARAPCVLSLLAELYGRKPLPFQTLNFRIGSEQETHSDTVHFNSMPAGYMCGVWVALEDVDRDNGPVMYFPGSHKWPEVALPDVDEFGKNGWIRKKLARLQTRTRIVRETGADYEVYEKVIQQRINASAVKPVYATIKKGQAFIWAANLLHGGSPQLDRSRTRASQVTHFFFDGCRYYTPLLQRGPKTHWRSPDWIV